MKKCSVGGQAVMEGVMMKSDKGIAMAVRRADGKIVPISVAASARSFMCREASGTSCAAVSMPRQMP
mgnify:CR=1 FL=1